MRTKIILPLVAMAAFAAPSQSVSPLEIARTDVTVLNAGFLHWVHEHPEVLGTSRSLRLNLPSLDLYSKEGNSIYHGDDPSQNAAFIRGLPANPQGKSRPQLRPTLHELIEMIPALRDREKASPSASGYTIVAITYPDWSYCEPQNRALQEFARRLNRNNIRIIEIQLQKPNGGAE